MGGGMTITEVRPRLYLIGLEQEIKRFGIFIGAWVYDGEEIFLVDVGPRASVDQLLKGLESLKICRLDFIFLTHIHIDHAGGTGILVNHFPDAKVICHESGIPHMIRPQKLWEGGKRALGDLALKYGKIEPVPENRLLSPDEFKKEGFQIINTPGHAPHHSALIYKEYLFAGDAGGISIDLGDKSYLRPATPSRFMFEEAVESIDTLLEMDIREICYAHFGIHPDAKGMLRNYRKQLYLWRDVIAEQMKDLGEQDLVERCIPVLLERDDLFKSFKDLTEEEKSRERFFIKTCIQGISEYIMSRSSFPLS
jgi:glyoxylase-like metal-dependent hydrolase (beta-lactamase superfamily II)